MFICAVRGSSLWPITDTVCHLSLSVILKTLRTKMCLNFVRPPKMVSSCALYCSRICNKTRRRWNSTDNDRRQTVSNVWEYLMFNIWRGTIQSISSVQTNNTGHRNSNEQAEEDWNGFIVSNDKQWGKSGRLPRSICNPQTTTVSAMYSLVTKFTIA